MPDIPPIELQETLALIKPDAFSHQDAIVQAIKDEGFNILQMKTTQLTREQAESFYAEHQGRPFFETLTTFMSSGPIVSLHLSAPQAIKKWRTLIGPTNTQKAKEESPNSLRAKFGTDGTKNACHGSDSPASAQRELTFFFPSTSVKEPLAVRNKLNEELYPTLTEGLAELSKARPADPVTWLGEWLLQHRQ